MCEMPESTKETGKSVRQLLVIAALMVIGYTCVHTLRFTIGSINFILSLYVLRSSDSCYSTRAALA